MHLRSLKRAPLGAVRCGTVWLALAAASASGQGVTSGGPRDINCLPPPCAAPQKAPVAPTETFRPEVVRPGAEPGQALPQEPAFSFAPERALALGGETTTRAQSSVGYIDSAIPLTQFRLRFDAAYDDNRPDRAEFFYAKCGCFRINGSDPKAPGPPGSPPSRIETSVDYQDIASYLELAVNQRISAFVEVPVRFLNPEVLNNTAGIGDMNAGFKVALLHDDCRFVTFQFRTYIPTGKPEAGLGTDHVSLEPALLGYQRLTDRLVLEGELRDWIPIGGTDFAGNIIRYGAGLGYDAFRSCKVRVTPVAEFVGWTVLGGKELAVAGPVATVLDASGDTIVNLKVGARVGIGEHSDLYFGYGRALTGAVWYKDILRLEYRLIF